MLRKWIVYGAEIIAANCGLNVATKFGNKVLEECVHIEALVPNYHFYDEVERDDKQVKMCIGADGEPRKIWKCLKANTVKKVDQGD